MNLKEIEEMIKLMNENKLTELEVEKNGFKVRLKKEDGNIKKTIEEVPSKRKAQEEIIEESQAESSVARELIEIKAPMVGTFYRSPSPETPPFVEVGQEINPGDVICILEAMKLMNEIKSEVKGKITEILIESGNPVEFGQILFLVEPKK